VDHLSERVMRLIEIPLHVPEPVAEAVHVLESVPIPQQVGVLVDSIHVPEHVAESLAGLLHLLAHLSELLVGLLLGHPLIGFPEPSHHLLHLLLHFLHSLHPVRLVLMLRRRLVRRLVWRVLGQQRDGQSQSQQPRR
jgi:hypothetical protein